MSTNNVSGLFTADDATAREANDRCYRRWHAVLQEGLVPATARGLGLLEPEPGGGDGDDDGGAYLAALTGMEEEVRVMAVLARAAAPDEGGEDNRDMEGGDGGTARIADAMRCAALLLFHVVLASSTPQPSSDGTAPSAAGYDGRVRHVVKLACVDVLARAFVEAVEAGDDGVTRAPRGASDAEGGGTREARSPAWDVAAVRAFLEREDLGRGAVFGSPFGLPLEGKDEGGRPSATPGSLDENGRDDEKAIPERLLLSDGDTAQSSNQEAETDRGPTSRASSPGASESPGSVGSPSSNPPDPEGTGEGERPSAKPGSLDGNERDGKEAIPERLLLNSDGDASQSSDQEAETDQGPTSRASSPGVPGVGGSPSSDPPESASALSEGARTPTPSVGSSECESRDKANRSAAEEDGEVCRAAARRRRNAKFLATRKFELVERVVAIDIVRFLMVEERERKLRENRNEERQRASAPPPGAGSADGVGTADAKEHLARTGVGRYFTASQVLRGAKIAGMGVALGTAFAITGGLAAPGETCPSGGLAAPAPACWTT